MGLRKVWKITSVQVPPDMFVGLKLIRARFNVTSTMLFNSLILAILNGDIKLKKDVNRKTKTKSSVMNIDDDPQLFYIEFYDKEGNLINPNKDKFEA